MDNKKIVEFLKKTLLFQHLTEDQLNSISVEVKVRQFFPDDIIVWQGQPSNTLFLIANGIVAVKNVTNERENLLAYLMPGQSFGEVGILENQPRSASVQALSEVDVLVIQRDDFLAILEKYSSVAVELARLLGRYLVDASRRLSQEDKKIQVILLFNLDMEAGGISIASFIAQAMYETDYKSTAYVEYRDLQEIRDVFQRPGGSVIHHPGGFDIVLPKEDTFLPNTTQTTLLIDRLKNNYDNIVISLGGHFDKSASILVEQANQVLVMSSPTDDARSKIDGIVAEIRKHVQPGETSIFTLLSKLDTAYKDNALEPPQADFEIPFLPNFKPMEIPRREKLVTPEPIARIVGICIERLERTHTIGVYIPTTVDVDQKIDTLQYKKAAMEFMAERFGGATSYAANGVWSSKESGLVGEEVHIVESYMTQGDINLYLDEIVNFVKVMKDELKQEAMALEVDRKLTLI
jgi:CRP-like cAMP-binding protein